MSGETFITRAGCRITVERVGPSIGVTIHPAGDKPRLYACGADETAAVAALIAPEAVREARAKSLEEAAEVWDSASDTDPGRGSAAWEATVRLIRDEVSAWLRDRAARERKAGT